MSCNALCEKVGTCANGCDSRIRAQREFEVVSEAFSRRLREGSVPPDDAYWWTRVIVEEARHGSWTGVI